MLLQHQAFMLRSAVSLTNWFLPNRWGKATEMFHKLQDAADGLVIWKLAVEKLGTETFIGGADSRMVNS
jgi:hypothetical protein